VEPANTISLVEGQSLVLPSHTSHWPALQLAVEAGVGRVYGEETLLLPSMSLAFCGSFETSWLWLTPSATWFLEALTSMSLQVERVPATPAGADLIAEWQLDLHRVRHPVGADRRVIEVLRLLIQHFGIRVSRGYRLSFVLSHGRIAELIGVTRSTVTHQLTLLREQGLLSVDRLGSLMAAPALIEIEPPPTRSRSR